MVKLYVADISNLPDPLSVPDVLQTLPMDRQNRIHNMKQEKSRKQSMGVGLLLQKVLALYHMQDSQVYMGENGKPMIDGLEFSLSHSDKLVLCAVSDMPVGCDVERLREAPRRVAERYFSETEQVYLSQFDGKEYDRAFFRLWTMKESYVKMTGEGLGVPFEAYEVIDCVGECEETQAYCLNSMELHGYIISICAQEASPVEVIWTY